MTSSNGSSSSSSSSSITSSSSRVTRSEANNGFYFLPFPSSPICNDRAMHSVGTLRKICIFLFNKFLKVHWVGEGPLVEQQQISTGVGVAVQRLGEGGRTENSPKRM